MTGYITFYSSAEINELELSQFATDLFKQGGVVRQGGNLGFAAAQLSPLDGLKYNVTAGGSFYIPNSSYAANGSNPRFWLGRVSGATETLTFAANSSGSTRIDLIAIKVDTTVTDANADNTGVVSLVVVQGTPGAGVPATPNNHIALYTVTIANGETEITDTEVTDVRTENKLINTLYDEIELDNNKAIKEKDSTGTLRNLLKLNASNELEILGAGITKLKLMLNNIFIEQLNAAGSAALKLIGLNSSNQIIIGENDQADHTVINAGSSKLVKIKVLRRNSGSSSYEANTVIVTGWGYWTGDNTNTLHVNSQSWGITFAGRPVVTIGFLGTKSGSNPSHIGDFGDIGAPATYTNFFVCWMGGISTTGGSASFRTGGVYGTSIRTGFSWIAIGQLT